MSQLQHIEVSGKMIGTVHVGTVDDTSNDNVIHININPVYFGAKYTVGRIHYDYGRVYIELLKEEEQEIKKIEKKEFDLNLKNEICDLLLEYRTSIKAQNDPNLEFDETLIAGLILKKVRKYGYPL